MNKLNIGSGEFLKEGYINVDFYSITKPDVEHDLSIFPYPFNDNQFDLIESDHCLEHLPSPFDVMKEIHRIGKPGALVKIKVPHFSRGFTHAEHKAGFDVTFPYYFNKDFKGGYQGVQFECIQVKLTWFAQPYFKKTVLSSTQFYLATALGNVFDFLANLSPFITSRLWCFWVGGFEEVSFEFKIIKP